MTILLICAVIGCLPAAIAQGKGGNFALWWIYGAALFIVALPHSLMMADRTPQPARVPYRPSTPTATPAAPRMKTCPDCAEQVQADARICRFCRHEFSFSARAADAPHQDSGALARLMPLAPDWRPAPRPEAELTAMGERVCAICHRHNPPELDACPGCGARLKPRGQGDA